MNIRKNLQWIACIKNLPRFLALQTYLWLPQSLPAPLTALILILLVFPKFHWSGLILIVQIITSFPDFITFFFTWWQHIYGKSVEFGLIWMSIYWTYSTRFHLVTIFIICEEIISKEVK